MSVMVITKDNFDLEVLKESKTVLLDFWQAGAVLAAWFPPLSMKSEPNARI